MNIPCPKCSSTSTRLEDEGSSILLKCVCGYCKVMVTTLRSGMVIEHIHIDGGPQLPKTGSKLAQCLGSLASLGEGSTQQVADKLSQRGGVWSSDEVASFLTILKHRGLVCIVVPGKGKLGGSRWRLTDKAKTLLKL